MLIPADGSGEQFLRFGFVGPEKHCGTGPEVQLGLLGLDPLIEMRPRACSSLISYVDKSLYEDHVLLSEPV